MRTLEEVYDYYQAAVYDRALLVGSIERHIVASGSKRVLDCACGTGLPSIDLRERGYEIDCSDADQLMLDQFRRNASERGVSDSVWRLRWNELSSLHTEYDFVMCRGNSLVYASSWEHDEAPAASVNELERHIIDISVVVRPGGYLMVDAPRTSSLAEAVYPATVFRGEWVLVKERVIFTGGYRRWEQRVRIGSEETCFVRRSSNLVAATLAEILARNGYNSVRSVEVPGERSSYAVLLAQKSAC